MARRLRDLSLERLPDLPAACRDCVFWEVAGARRGPAPRPDVRARHGKEAWWQATQLEWGVPGKALYVDDRLVGYASFAPGAHFPRIRRLGADVSDDALLLAALWVDPQHRGAGLGKLLLQSVLRETARRGGRALEAFATRHAGTAPCVLPESFLLRHGFSVLHDDALTPLLRLDLRQTVRWSESVGHALEGVLSALQRRERAPARPALEAVPAELIAPRPR